MIEIYIYIYINIELLFNTVCIIVPFSLWLQIYPNIYLCLFPSHQVLRQMCLRSASAMDWSCASGWDFVFFSLNLLKPSQETTLSWKWHVYVYNPHVGVSQNQFGPKPGIRCHGSTIPQMDLFAIIRFTKSCLASSFHWFHRIFQCGMWNCCKTYSRPRRWAFWRMEFV